MLAGYLSFLLVVELAESLLPSEGKELISLDQLQRINKDALDGPHLGGKG